MQRAHRHSNNWNHFNANWQSTGTTWIIRQHVEQSCPYVVWLWNDFTCLFLSLWSSLLLRWRVTGSQSLTTSWDLFFKWRCNLKPNGNGWNIDRFNYSDVETNQEAFTGNMEKIHGLFWGHIYPPTWGHIEIIQLCRARVFHIQVFLDIRVKMHMRSNHRHRKIWGNQKPETYTEQ